MSMRRFSGLLVFGFVCFLGGSLASSKTDPDRIDVPFRELPCAADSDDCAYAFPPMPSSTEPKLPLRSSCSTYLEPGEVANGQRADSGPINIAARAIVGFYDPLAPAMKKFAKKNVSTAEQKTLAYRKHYFVILDRCSTDSTATDKPGRITSQILRFPVGSGVPFYVTHRTFGEPMSDTLKANTQKK